MFCDASYTNWGMVFTVSHRKRMVTGVTDRGVRVRRVMKWHGLYQSVSHSVTPVVPEYRLPLRPASPSHGRGSASGKLSFFFRFPFAPSTGFYLNFTSCPFSVYYFLNSNSGSRRRGEGGKHAKRCGIFLSFLAPMAIRHKALCPFLHAFFFSLSPSTSSTSSMKSHSKSSQQTCFFFLFLVFSLVCPLHASSSLPPSLLSVLLKEWKW